MDFDLVSLYEGLAKAESAKECESTWDERERESSEKITQIVGSTVVALGGRGGVEEGHAGGSLRSQLK